MSSDDLPKFMVFFLTANSSITRGYLQNHRKITRVSHAILQAITIYNPPPKLVHLRVTLLVVCDRKLRCSSARNCNSKISRGICSVNTQFLVHKWGCVKTLYPCSSHQNSWDLWMFIPLKMAFIGIDPYPNIQVSDAFENPRIPKVMRHHGKTWMLKILNMFRSTKQLTSVLA